MTPTNNVIDLMDSMDATKKLSATDLEYLAYLKSLRDAHPSYGYTEAGCQLLWEQYLKDRHYRG
jgi:hypothetical protein